MDAPAAKRHCQVKSEAPTRVNAGRDSKRFSRARQPEDRNSIRETSDMDSWRMRIAKRLKRPDQKKQLSAERNRNVKTADKLVVKRMSPEMVAIENPQEKKKLHDIPAGDSRDYNEVFGEVEKCLMIRMTKMVTGRADSNVYRRSTERLAKS